MPRRLIAGASAPYRGDTWRRFGYALVCLPAGIAGMALVAAGRAGVAARWQLRVATRLLGPPAGTPRPASAGRVLLQSACAVAIGAASWFVVQFTAFIVLINVAYPWRDYLTAENGPDNAPPIPWLAFSIHRPDHPVDIWASTYHNSWGGPTLAGAWLVHAALTLLVFYPVVARLVRGLARVQRGLTGRLLAGTLPAGRLLAGPEPADPAGGRRPSAGTGQPHRARSSATGSGGYPT